jgi:CheY-like chemotaxis protein
VDDEPFNIIALEGLFQQFGVEKVDRAFNGREAIRLIEKNANDPACGLVAPQENSDPLGLIPRKSLHQHERYRLVMLDNNMPIMTGLEAAVNLRQMHDRQQADLRNTKLILITGDEVRGSRVDSDFKAIIAKVFDDILSKPLTRLEFEAFIKRNHAMFSQI